MTVTSYFGDYMLGQALASEPGASVGIPYAFLLQMARAAVAAGVWAPPAGVPVEEALDLFARYPAHRDDLVDFACEPAAMDLRAAVYPEPPCPPVDEDVAARALARFRRVEAEILARA